MDALYPRGVDSAKVIQVIVTTSARGRGTPDQPCRIVTEYWSLDGKKLAEHDDYLGSIDDALSKASSEGKITGTAKEIADLVLEIQGRANSGSFAWGDFIEGLTEEQAKNFLSNGSFRGGEEKSS